MPVADKGRGPKTVILVNPFFQHQKNRNVKDAARRKVQRQYPPVNLLMIGGVLKAAGFRVEILDCFVEKNPLAFIDRVMAEHEVVMVGVTVKMAPLITFAMQLSYYVKRNYPHAAVIWGGLLPTIMPEQVLREAYVDYAVVAQGEDAALALCRALAEGREPGEIPGVARLGGASGAELVLTPPSTEVRDTSPDWTLIGDKLNHRQQPYYAGSVTTRGCRHGCSFCYLTALDKSLEHLKRWYERPMELVLRDIDALMSYGMNVFTFQDDCFLMNKERVLRLVAELKKREAYIEQCVTSIRTIDPEVVREIAPIVQQISYSIETVNPELQKILNKPIPEAMVLEKDALLSSHGINSVHNFIFGIPGETDDDLRLNIDLAVKLRRLNPHVRFSGMFCIPYPKSRLETWVNERLGLWIPWDLRMLSTTDMTFLTVNPAFQPWIKSPEQARFYNEFMIVFEAVFSRWQFKGDPRVEGLLRQPRMARLFEEAVTLDPPPDRAPYILDRLLENPGLAYPDAKVGLDV